MIYTQQSNLPIIFQVDEGIINDVNYYLSRNNLQFNNVLVVSGKTRSYFHAEKISRTNGWSNFIIEDNTFSEVERLKKYINNNNIDLLIGVGGGKVIDTVKRASYLSNTNNLSIPTIISNDGLISPIAVIKNELGKTESLPGMMPMGVIIDLDIIKDSPDRFLIAAVGDVFSNISATNDWILAFKNQKERMNDIAFHLSKSAANSLVYCENVDVHSKPFLRLVVQGLVNSGIAMSLAGTSRPCSGSEHLISHAMDYIGCSKNVLHGTQVASISLFTLFLQDKLEEKHLSFAKKIDIPLDFSSLVAEFSKELFMEIVEKAREMRIGRYSILTMIDNEELYSKFLEYQHFINSKQ